jgi:hypothetical protein
MRQWVREWTRAWAREIPLTRRPAASNIRRGNTVTRRRGSKAKNGEEGFVLLLIFAMAAAVALMPLYRAAAGFLRSPAQPRAVAH